jgi:hypothetical protein
VTMGFLRDFVERLRANAGIRAKRDFLRGSEKSVRPSTPNRDYLQGEPIDHHEGILPPRNPRASDGRRR